MSNIIDNEFGNETNNSLSRVSYTLNNEQPVISTYIGTQPLFYMDSVEEDILEEELEFDAAELGILENELAALGNELKTLDKFSAEFSRSPDDNIDIFMDAKDSILGRLNNKSSLTIKQIRTHLEKSRLAAAFLEIADQYNIELRCTTEIADACYDRKSGLILINENLSATEQILLASRELRRHWQHRQGALIDPLNFHPDSAIIINRAAHADLASSMIRVAWELQLSGNKEVWEYIENSSFADLGRAFIREAYADFRTINNGQATTAVFEAWFLSERCRAEDKTLIRQMLADHEGQVFDVENVHTAITPAFIAALGEMPFGKNYLAIHADTVLTDPIFNEVRDRANANFLWFIKFERTFRETERDLQTEFSSASDMSVQSIPTQDIPDEDKIITLYDTHTQPGTNRDQRPTGDESGDNILYIRNIPGE